MKTHLHLSWTALLALSFCTLSFGAAKPRQAELNWNPQDSIMSDWQKDSAGNASIDFDFKDLTARYGFKEQMANPNIRLAFDRFLNARTTTGNSAELLINGANSFERRDQIIRDAKESILISTFYWFPDLHGLKILPLLAQKIEEGVTVRIIFDALAAYSGHKKFYDDVNIYIRSRYEALKDRYPRFAEELKTTPRSVWMFHAPEALVKTTFVKHDEQERNLQLKTDRFVEGKFLQIIHNKMLVIDGKKAIIGGMNIADSYAYGGATTTDKETGALTPLPQREFSADEIQKLRQMLPNSYKEINERMGEKLDQGRYNPQLGWRDTDILVEGDAAKELQHGWNRFWNYAMLYGNKDGSHSASLYLGNAWNTVKEPEISGLLEKDYLRNENQTRVSNVAIRKVEHIPQLGEPYFFRHMRWLLASAKKYLYIHAPYAVFPQELQDWMVEAATRKDNPIRIVIFTNSRESNDWKADMTWAARRQCLDLAQRTGGRIATLEWALPTLHSKVILADDYVVSVGTNNYDIQSMSLSSETAVTVFDEKFAAITKEMFRTDSNHSKFIDKNTLDEWYQLTRTEGISDLNEGPDFLDRFRERFLLNGLVWPISQANGGHDLLERFAGF
ncbi:phosphatidylserine/phosphatidylglycerophosphate/cardiolipin synthase family protein [Bdellovibrionota bacterium FG-2]